MKPRQRNHYEDPHPVALAIVMAVSWGVCAGLSYLFAERLFPLILAVPIFLVSLVGGFFVMLRSTAYLSRKYTTWRAK